MYSINIIFLFSLIMSYSNIFECKEKEVFYINDVIEIECASYSYSHSEMINVFGIEKEFSTYIIETLPLDVPYISSNPPETKKEKAYFNLSIYKDADSTFYKVLEDSVYRYWDNKYSEMSLNLSSKDKETLREKIKGKVALSNILVNYENDSSFIMLKDESEKVGKKVVFWIDKYLFILDYKGNHKGNDIGFGVPTIFMNKFLLFKPSSSRFYIKEMYKDFSFSELANNY